MDFLNLRPDSDGYSDTDPSNSIAVALDGGSPRVRLDRIGGSKSVTLKWTLDRLQWAYLRAFYRTTIKDGSLPFECELVSEDGDAPVRHVCTIVPGSFGLTSQAGLTYVVKAQVWAKMLPRDAAEDKFLVDFYGLYGEATASRLAELARLANVTMPATLA